MSRGERNTTTPAHLFNERNGRHTAVESRLPRFGSQFGDLPEPAAPNLPGAVLAVQGANPSMPLIAPFSLSARPFGKWISRG